MNLRQLAKHLDARAMKFARSGDFEKSIASLSAAAYIRRQPKEFQQIVIPPEYFEANK